MTASSVRTLQADLVLDARATLGEGPVWDDRTGTLLWVDILQGLVHRYSPETQQDEVLAVGQPVGAVASRQRGGLVLAVRDGFALFDDRGFRLVSLVEADRPTNRMNDGKCDPTGRFLAGTMDVDAQPGRGALYRLDPDHSVTTLIRGVTISNGLAWSADHRTMYYIDSSIQGVDAFDYDLDSGRIKSNRRTVAQIPASFGMPDGMTWTPRAACGLRSGKERPSTATPPRATWTWSWSFPSAT
jgi:sugar lactone lactonase YvrE